MDSGESFPAVTALILAGGRGSRMGGLDKGLQNFHGLPLALQTLMRLQSQSRPPQDILINANRNLAAYESFGAAVWPDSLEGYAGPLAGFLTGLEHCETPLLLTVPCDTPLFPLDLIERLQTALLTQGAELAMAFAPEEDGQVRSQPVFCLMRAELQESLVAFTRGGGRKIDAWTAGHVCVQVRFDQPGDCAHAFFNANSLPELQHLETL